MRILKTAFVMTAFFLAAGITAAQADSPPLQPARQNLRENFITLRLLRLTQALDLTEDQTAKFFPVLTRMEKDKLRIQRDMSADVQALRRLVRDAASKETDITVRVKAVQDARLKVKTIDDEIEAFLEKNLTPIQKGKYILFEIDFFRGLGDTLNQIRQQRRGMSVPPPEPIKK